MVVHSPSWESHGKERQAPGESTLSKFYLNVKSSFTKNHLVTVSGDWLPEGVNMSVCLWGSHPSPVVYRYPQGSVDDFQYMQTLFVSPEAAFGLETFCFPTWLRKRVGKTVLSLEENRPSSPFIRGKIRTALGVYFGGPSHSFWFFSNQKFLPNNIPCSKTLHPEYPREGGITGTLFIQFSPCRLQISPP